MKTTVAMMCLMAAGIFIAAGPNAGTVENDRGKALSSLIDAERAFSRTSGTKGIREAFLTWLAPDATVFQPGPVEGRPVYEKMDPANPAVLTWEPEIAEVAASGELGYTSGPYEVRPNRGAEPTGFGHYVSVWKKQADGTWKVLLDIGVQHGPPKSLATVQPVATPQARAAFETLSPEALREEEQAFGERAGSFEKEAASRGSRRALSAFATDDIRIYRPGRFPSVGRRAVDAIILSGAGRIAPASERRNAAYQVGLAWSGDLAYCYGTFEILKVRAVVETKAYLRIWRKDTSGIWKLCLDIELPVPPDAGKKI
jgi:ketosteroid isomerase-like protein